MYYHLLENFLNKILKYEKYYNYVKTPIFCYSILILLINQYHTNKFHDIKCYYHNDIVIHLLFLLKKN